MEWCLVVLVVISRLIRLSLLGTDLNPLQSKFLALMKEIIYFILALAALIVTIHWTFATKWSDHEPIVGILVSIPAVMVTYENLPKPISWPSFRWLTDSFFRRVAEFLSSRIFLGNLAGVFYVLLMMYFTMTGFLRIYTNHGESIQLPDFIGLTKDIAIERAEELRFKVKLDSHYVHNKIPGEIHRQNPPPFTRVKEGRTLYLAYTLPYGVEVFFKPTTPNFKNAKLFLESEGIYVYNMENLVDDTQEEGTIVKAKLEGKIYSMADLQQNGIVIRQGKSIEFLVTAASQRTNTELPNLVCKTYAEAKFLLQASNFKIGDIQSIDEVSDASYIWKQDPVYSPDKLLPRGIEVDLYLKLSVPDDCQ